MKGVVKTEFEDLSLDFAIPAATVRYHYDRGRYSGPPEDCYPAEFECEVEVHEVVLSGFVSDECQFPDLKFTDKMTPGECYVAVAQLLQRAAALVYEAAEVVAHTDIEEGDDY